VFEVRKSVPEKTLRIRVSINKEGTIEISNKKNEVCVFSSSNVPIGTWNHLVVCTDFFVP